MSFLKGASAAGGEGGGDENTNKFEKLKANKQIPVKREEVCSQLQTKEFASGVCNVTTWASTSGNFKAISSSSLSFEGGIGGKGRRGGCQIQSVINEHFKRPNCGR